MDPSDPAPGDVLEAQLLALDESDADPRALYRTLAEDPDQALELESELKELHARRLDLAQRVCLAALVCRRASAKANEHQTDPVPVVDHATSSATEANGIAVEREPDSEPPVVESPPPPRFPKQAFLT